MTNKLVEEAPYHPGYEDVGFKNKMNNEPVAWTDGEGNYFDKNSFFPVYDLIPLYTHPAKTLTDEEIKEVLTEIAINNENVYSFDGYDMFESMEFSKVGIFAFARAILRKAQEK